MEFFIIFVLITVGFFAYQYFCYKRDMKIKAAVTDLLNRMVICHVEQRDGQYFLYHEITKQFLAQGKTPQEVLDNLPKNDGKFYMAQDGHREIKEELEEIECMRLKST